MEYLDLYYYERTSTMKGSDGFLSKEERMAMVQQSIDQTGTYEHTFDELEHGARIAWRNAPKCSNRKYWQQLKLLDARNVSTNKGMFKACMKHLSKAVSLCGIFSYIDTRYLFGSFHLVAHKAYNILTSSDDFWLIGSIHNSLQTCCPWRIRWSQDLE